MKHFFRWLKALLNRSTDTPDNPELLREQVLSEARDAQELARRDRQDVLDRIFRKW